MRWLSQQDNRGRVVLITATLCMWLLILLAFKYYGYKETWLIRTVRQFPSGQDQDTPSGFPSPNGGGGAPACPFQGLDRDDPQGP